MLTRQRCAILSRVKATGLQGEALPEVIEIIDDGVDAFADRGPATSTEDPGGRRWVGPVAAAALLGLIGFGVVTSATNGVPKVAAPPSTTAAPATTPAPTTTATARPASAPTVPYYAADPPRQFAVQSAELRVPDTRRLRENNYQLWETTGGASASDGSWFSIESFQTGPDSQLTVDAYRAGSGDRPVAISHLPTGQAIAEFVADNTVQVTVTSFGWSDEDLLTLAQSITVNDNDVEVGDPSLTAGYALVTTVPPWLAIEGRPVEQIVYTSSTDPSGGFFVVVAERPPIPGGVKSRERQIALRFLLEQTTAFDVGGHSGIAGVVIGRDPQSIATWVADNHIVSVFADMPVADLIEIAQSVHEVPVDTWRGLQFQAAVRGGGNDTDGQSEANAPVTVSSGTDTDADPWAVSVGIASFGNQRQITWQWDQNSFGVLAAAQPAINTLVDSRRTYVLAQLPRDVAPTAELQINRSGLDPVVVPFHDIDAWRGPHVRRVRVQRAGALHRSDRRRRRHCARVVAAMKPDDMTAVIEIIDDDTNPFGDRAQTHTVHDTGGPRWVGPVAGAALVAIVGFGVVTSASGGAPKVAPAPTTTSVAASTTVPSSTSSTVAAAPRIGYYAASPPDDFTIEFADAGEVGRAFFPGIYGLWATPDSSATAGSWFSIQTAPGSPYSEDAFRVQVGRPVDRHLAYAHWALAWPCSRRPRPALSPSLRSG